VRVGGLAGAEATTVEILLGETEIKFAHMFHTQHCCATENWRELTNMNVATRV
jgi:hypothetical protein